MNKPVYEGHLSENLIITPIQLPEYVQGNDGKETKIEFHQEVINRLQRLSGIKTLIVTLTNDDLERQSDITGSINVFADGSASGAKVRRKQYQDESDISFINQGLMTGREGIVTLRLNRNEATDRILERGGNIRSLDEWSEELDSMIKERIFRFGKKNLLEMDNWNAIFTTMFYTGNMIGQLIGSRSLTSLELLIPHALIASFVFNCMFKAVLGKNHRLSIIMGPQIDYALLLAIQCSSLGKRVVTVEGNEDKLSERLKTKIRRSRQLSSRRTTLNLK